MTDDKWTLDGGQTDIERRPNESQTNVERNDMMMEHMM